MPVLLVAFAESSPAKNWKTSLAIIEEDSPAFHDNDRSRSPRTSARYIFERDATVPALAVPLFRRRRRRSHGIYWLPSHRLTRLAFGQKRFGYSENIIRPLSTLLFFATASKESGNAAFLARLPYRAHRDTIFHRTCRFRGNSARGGAGETYGDRSRFEMLGCFIGSSVFIEVLVSPDLYGKR